MKILPCLMLLCLMLLVLACEGSTSVRRMSDEALMAKRDECLRRNPTAPGYVVACENIRKECERRKKARNYSC